MRKLSVSEWCCAVRFNNNDNSVMTDLCTPFVVLPNSKRYWCADPFLFQKDGHYYVFFEAYDRLKRKGVLGYRQVAENTVGDIRIIYEAASHLSYPFIYEADDDIYIVPESNISGELYRLKCLSFPDKWEKEKVLLKARLVDSTFFVKNGEHYCFSMQVDDDLLFDRLDLFYYANGEWVPCPKNPVKRDLATARSAGKCFEYDGVWYRPSQDCSNGYGCALRLNVIDKINSNEYMEHCTKKLRPSEIQTNTGVQYQGIHTYNRLKHVEVIDLKTPPELHILNLLGGFWKRVRNMIK